jgi:hypothetical protein
VELTCGHRANSWVTIFYTGVDAPCRRFCDIDCLISWHRGPKEHRWSGYPNRPEEELDRFGIRPVYKAPAAEPPEFQRRRTRVEKAGPPTLVEKYREVEEQLQNSGRQVKLVGRASYSRPCPKCRAPIPKDEEIINYGKIEGHWVWICVDCAPEDPYQTPHLQELQ